MRFERPPSPIAGDVTEHTVFDLVPLAGAGRKVADFNRLANLIGEFLELQLPEATPTAVAAPTVRSDEQTTGRRVSLGAHALPPLTNCGHSELGGIAADADADPSFV